MTDTPTTAEVRAACQLLIRLNGSITTNRADQDEHFHVVRPADILLVAGWAERAAERVEQLESENSSLKRDLDHVLLCGYPVVHHPDGCPALAAAAAPPAREGARIHTKYSDATPE